MFYFLPQDSKKEAVSEYRQRLAIVGTGLLLAFLVAGCVLALPTYQIMKIRKESAVLERDALVTSLKDDPAMLQAEVRDINGKVSTLKGTSESATIMATLDRLLAQRGNSIAITNVSIKRSGTGSSLTLSGIASTRDALVAFSKRLQGEPSFKNVNLPVNSLARSKDIVFNISIDSAI